jgi:hypothetical protein
MSFIYCQRKEELQKKCKTQCDHCKIYYAPMEEFHKKDITEYRKLTFFENFLVKMGATVVYKNGEPKFYISSIFKKS